MIFGCISCCVRIQLRVSKKDGTTPAFLISVPLCPRPVAAGSSLLLSKEEPGPRGVFDPPAVLVALLALLSQHMTANRDLGLVHGKAGTWRGSYILSPPFRLFVGRLGVAGMDQEGQDPCAADSIPAAPEHVASPMILPLCQKGS